MNFYDSGKISDLLNVHGYKEINNISDADLVVLNTCHIREKASEKLFSDLGRIKKLKKFLHFSTKFLRFLSRFTLKTR